MQWAGTNQTDSNPFQRQGIRIGDDNRLKVRILGQEDYLIAGARQALDGDIVANTDHHDLPITCFAGFLDGQQKG